MTVYVKKVDIQQFQLQHLKGTKIEFICKSIIILDKEQHQVIRKYILIYQQSLLVFRFTAPYRDTYLCCNGQSSSFYQVSFHFNHTHLYKKPPKKSYKYRKLSNICSIINVLSVDKLTAFLVSHSYIGVEFDCFTGQGSILGLIADVAHL